MNRNKILIIEDDEDMRRGLNIRLRASEYDTAFASDAVMALSIAKKEAPDLILLDLGLPGGDGFTVLDRMKNIASLACTPVIVVSLAIRRLTSNARWTPASKPSFKSR